MKNNRHLTTSCSRQHGRGILLPVKELLNTVSHVLAPQKLFQ
jgi:hypothetical protein